MRRDVIERCANGDPKSSDPLKWFPLRPVADRARPTAIGAAAGFDEFQDVVVKATFTVEGDSRTYKQLDLFKYIMQARTWAFVEAQQQRTLNEFWYVVAKENKLMPDDMLVKAESEHAKAAPAECYLRPERRSPGSTTEADDKAAVDKFDTACSADASGKKTYENEPTPIGR